MLLKTVGVHTHGKLFNVRLHDRLIHMTQFFMTGIYITGNELELNCICDTLIFEGYFYRISE